MTDDEKRAYVANEYPSQSWKDKVAKMSTDQVTAIYIRLISKKN